MREDEEWEEDSGRDERREEGEEDEEGKKEERRDDGVEKRKRTKREDGAGIEKENEGKQNKDRGR